VLPALPHVGGLEGIVASALNIVKGLLSSLKLG
jgi:hypothetical protein